MAASSRRGLIACVWLLAGLIALMHAAKQFMAPNGASYTVQSSRVSTGRNAGGVPPTQRQAGGREDQKNRTEESTGMPGVSAAIVGAAMIGLSGMMMPKSAEAAQVKQHQHAQHPGHHMSMLAVKAQSSQGSDISPAAVAGVVGAAALLAIPGVQAQTGNYTKRPMPVIAGPTDEEKAAEKAEKAAAKAAKLAAGKPTAKKINKDTAPTGNSLACALKFACDANKAIYAIYWIPVNGKFVAAGNYVVDNSVAKLNAGGVDFAAQHSKAETGKGSLLSQCSETQKVQFIKDASACPDKQRAGIFSKCGVKSVNIVPFDNGILEYGSDTAWSAPPVAPLVPINGMREAYEGYNSTYSIFWVKNKDGEFEACSDFVTPARKKALRNRRGDDKTFASASVQNKLGAASMVGQVAASGKEAFLENASEDPKFTRAALAKEFGVKSIRVIACEGGVMEYGIPKDDQLASNTLASMLKMRCDLAKMDFAIYWVEDDGKWVVAGDYATNECKKIFKDKRGDDERFETKCEKMKLDGASLQVGFAADAGATPAMGRVDLAKEFGIKTICQSKVRGGVLEYGTVQQLSARPDIPDLPEKELKTAFDEFGAVYTLLWVRRNGQWTVEGDFTTPERILAIQSTRSDGKTYGTECKVMKLSDSSVVGNVAQSKQTDVIYGADANKQFTRRALAKDFDIQTIRFVPCTDDVVLECGTSERKTTASVSSFRKDGKGGTDRGKAANMKRLMQDAAESPIGFMTPYVDAAKAMVGDGNILETRKNWIQDHTKLIGQGLKAAQNIWLEPLFSQFDKDGNGTIDRDEFGKYIETLSWGEKPAKAKIDKLMKNYDPSGDGGISIEEFADASPTFIKKSMIKLASKNGKNLGLMV